MLELFCRHAVRSVRRYLLRERGAKLLTLFGFFLTLLFVEVVAYESFYHGFRYVAQDEFFGEAFLLYVIELFYLVSFLLMFLSALLSGVFALFRDHHDTVLLASPAFASKLQITALRMFVSSLWPFVVIIVPALFALWRVYHTTLFGALLSFLGSALLTALAVETALLVILVGASLLDRLRIFRIRTLAFFLFGVAVGGGILIFRSFTGVNLIRMFQVRILALPAPDLSPILLQFQFFPSHYSAMSIFESRSAFSVSTAFYLLALLLLTLLVALGLYLLQKHYLSLWQKAQENFSGKHDGRSLPGRMLIHEARTTRSALSAKEFAIFLRNPRGLFWFGTILLIWGLAMGGGRLLARGLEAERVESALPPDLLQALALGIMLYFVMMFILRFAFPSFSAERRTSWIARSAPVDLGLLYDSKWRFFFLLFLVFSLLFAFMGADARGIPVSSVGLFALTVLLGVAFLTTLGLSLGALFPNNDTDDPEQLSTTMPGIAFIFVSLLYAFIAGVALASYSFYFGYYVFFALCSFSGTFFLFRVGRGGFRLPQE